MILCEENYFSLEAEQEYCGSTQLKRFCDCEAKAMAMIKGEWQDKKTSALLIGGYVDAAISGTLDMFKIKNPEIFKQDGTLYSKYLQAEEIVNIIENDDMLKKYVSGDNQRIFTGEIENLKFKVKTDSYFEEKNVCVDLKVLKDFEYIWNKDTREMENPIDYWKYTWQAAIYSEIIRQNTGKLPMFFIAAVTKEEEPDKAIMNIPEEVLLQKLEIIKTVIPRIKALKEGKEEPIRCEKCNYCKATKKINKIIDYREL